MTLAVHFSSGNHDWETPVALFLDLDKRWHFTLDVCATPANAKCKRYFTRADDGLAQPWRGVCWMNPPYGRQISGWLAKAARESFAGNATVVALVPSRTDTAWWHDWVAPYGEVEFLRGRIRFVGAPHPAPFPSAIVVFRAADADGSSNRSNNVRD
ncbi:MAG: DNA N-6-adenine-methyltransferase [Myxococcaceae bacterium]